MRLVSIRSCILVVLMLGCSDSVTDAPEDLAVGSVTANIDGSTAWRTTNAVAVYAGTRLVVSGTNDQSLAFGFGISTTQPGTYTVGSNFALSATLIATVSGALTTWEATGSGGSGTLTITSSDDRRIAGTFSFTLVRTQGTGTPATRTVTNGAFNVRY